MFQGTACAATGSASAARSHATALHAAQPGGRARPVTKPDERAVPQVVTVRKGDTLWSISRRYGVSVHQLEQWNGLTDQSVLQIGQSIIVGWVRAAAKATAKPTPSLLSSRSGGTDAEAGAAVLGLQVAMYAEQFIGAPYAWGGESAASGFDCSGLVQFAFAHFGIALGRTSYDQFHAGTAVERAQLAPGDLVFFDTYGPGASHVGIYVGNGRFVHAASGGVRTSNLDDAYWSAHYIGARRVVPG